MSRKGRDLDPSQSTNRKHRFQLASRRDMSTRHTRQNPENEDESQINKVLADAGVLEDNMSLAEKKKLLNVLQESKADHAESQMKRLSLNAATSPYFNHNPSNSPTHPSSSTILTPSCSPKEDQPSVECANYSTSDEDLFRDCEQEGLHGKDRHTSLEKVDNQDIIPHSATYNDAPNSEAGKGPGSARRVGLSRSGRGRGVPVKTKYDPLPMISPGKKDTPAMSPNNQNQQSIPENQSSARLVSNSLSTPHSPDAGLENSDENSSPPCHVNPPLSPQNSQDKVKSPEITSDESFEQVDVNSVDVPEVSSQIVKTDSEENKQESPSADDAKEEILETQEKKICSGNFFSHLSPLEADSNNTGIPHTPLIFEGLEKYKGNKSEWLMNAKKIIANHQRAYWSKLLSANPQWGPPIPDGGYNKRTLFKQPVPKYSRLFGNPSLGEKQAAVPVGSPSGRTERQAKTNAMVKIQDYAEDFPDPEFHSLRKRAQKSRENKTNQPEIKPVTPSGVWKEKKEADIVEHVEGKPELSDDGDEWASERIDQKSNQGDSDSDGAAEIAKTSASNDIYEYHEEETWSQAPKRNKNSKKGGKTDDHEVEVKTLQRSKGAGSLGKKSKLRLQKGAISHPSDHGPNSSLKSSRNRENSSEHVLGETNVRNNVNSENRGWLNTTQMKSESKMEIKPNKFFSSPRMQSQVQQSNHQQRGVRDSRRPVETPSPPVNAGSVGDGHCDEGAEAAAAPPKVPCPICGKDFPTNSIENHASECNEFSGIAEGEDLQRKHPTSEENDRTAIKILEVAEVSSKSRNCLKTECLTTDNHKNGKESCESSHVSSAGQKRASSVKEGEDDGPAKKSSRFVEK